MRNTKKHSEVIKYTIAGVIFGILFPFLSTSTEIIDHDLPFIFLYTAGDIQKEHLYGQLNGMYIGIAHDLSPF